MEKRIKSRGYGDISLQRGICSSCGEECLICKDGMSSCCGEHSTPHDSGYFVQEVPGRKRRRTLSHYFKMKILEEQENKCYWCGKVFGSYIMSPKGHLKLLTPCYDHYIPLSFMQGNRKDNFVAACQRCNLHKSAKIITSEQGEVDMKIYLQKKWATGGWEYLGES
jgi:hypothetical protein